MHELDHDVWTPKLVGDELLEAVKWANVSAGRIGPTGYRSGLPELMMLASDRDFEGWPPIQELEPARMRRGYSPARVSQLERALWWQTKYLPAQPGPARVLKVWVRAKLTRKMTFDAACDRMTWPRSTAYRARDKALMEIAVGLTVDGVARGRH